MNTIIFQKTYEIYSLLSKLIWQFPKKDRHSLGIRLETALLNLLEAIIEAEQTLPALKEKSLLGAIIKAELTKIFLRLSVENALIKETNYFRFIQTLVEIQKMLNGWRKSLRLT